MKELIYIIKEMASFNYDILSKLILRYGYINHLSTVVRDQNTNSLATNEIPNPMIPYFNLGQNLDCLLYYYNFQKSSQQTLDLIETINQKYSQFHRPYDQGIPQVNLNLNQQFNFNPLIIPNLINQSNNIEQVSQLSINEEEISKKFCNNFRKRISK